MATLHPEFMFTGSLSNISAYKRRDSNKIILRTKGGATKRKIKTHPHFERTRQLNKEFGGRSSVSEYIMRVLHAIKFIADYNIAGPLNTLLRPVQAFDSKSVFGQRHVMLSHHPYLVEGFNINRASPFDSMIRNAIQYSISRDTSSGSVTFPRLLPKFNFILPDGNYPYFQLHVVMGMVPDALFMGDRYRIMGDYECANIKEVESAWFLSSADIPSQQLEIQLQPTEYPLSYSLMMAAGVSFGMVGADGQIKPVKYVGSAKIVAMA
jgi:hypothetical protein